MRNKSKRKLSLLNIGKSDESGQGNSLNFPYKEEGK